MPSMQRHGGGKDSGKASGKASGMASGMGRDAGADTQYGRPGQPSEIASLFVKLASQESSFCTGQCFGTTGGDVGP